MLRSNPARDSQVRAGEWSRLSPGQGCLARTRRFLIIHHHSFVPAMPQKTFRVQWDWPLPWLALARKATDELLSVSASKPNTLFRMRSWRFREAGKRKRTPLVFGSLPLARCVPRSLPQSLLPSYRLAVVSSLTVVFLRVFAPLGQCHGIVNLLPPILQLRSLRYGVRLQIFQQGHQELPRQGHNADPSLPSAAITKPPHVPGTQRALRLES